MGADKSLPAGESIDTEMKEITAILCGESFRVSQAAFFEKHCNTFVDDDENKLEYTAIHKEYESLVEEHLKDQIGLEKLQKIEAGLSQYIGGGKKSTTDTKVLESIEILFALEDFVEFKKVMLVKKKELAGEIKGSDVNLEKMQKFGFIEVIDMKEHLDALAKI